MKIRSTCKAIELHMPKYYNYLKDLTISEFKRVQLTHILLGHWQEFPTIQDLETHSTHSKSYFSTFIKLLKDRGVEQEKYFNWENSENSFINILQDKPIPRSFGKILEEDEKNETFNERVLPGALVCNPITFKMEVFDGTDWKEIS